MTYVACEPISGTATIGDEEEIAEVAWLSHGQIPDFVPYGLYPRVQEYLDEVLPR
jgi:8-oxo-dGTP diphosphatase